MRKVARGDSQKKCSQISYLSCRPHLNRNYKSYFLDLFGLKATVKISLIAAHELRKKISWFKWCNSNNAQLKKIIACTPYNLTGFCSWLTCTGIAPMDLESTVYPSLVTFQSHFYLALHSVAFTAVHSSH